MADDEQFSLCWNNFNSNLSAGFHESLCRGDLVDVTLAAEGQFVKAHRLVLSVCSPYFRKMFTQMPANQHAFVFLKDVSHTALKDLIQFMYCGEVNVKQEALPAFISTAEALQIKGLTDSDPPPSQSPAEPSTPTPQTQQQQPQIASPRVRQRTSTRSYKIESVDDSGDDHHKQGTQIVIQTSAPSQQQTTTTIVQQPQLHHQTAQLSSSIAAAVPTTTAVVATTTHKRPAQRSSLGSAPHIKRTKSTTTTIDPLETTDGGAATTASLATTSGTQQITVQATVVASPPDVKQQQHHQQQQAQSEAEYIDLPIELPTKSEPDYSEDAGDVESADQDATYVEDESYGELRYDESYFTENEDAANTTAGGADASGTVTTGGATTSKAIVKTQQQQTSYSDASYVEVGDQTTNDAQESGVAIYSATSRGRVQLVYGGQPFIFEKNLKLPSGELKKYWRCNQWWNQKCRSRVYTINDIVVPLNRYHTHEEIVRRKKRTRKQRADATHSYDETPTATPVKLDKSSQPIITSLATVSQSEGDGINVSELGMHLKYEEIVADVAEVVQPAAATTAPALCMAKDIEK